ncbi:hypothetical protein [Streptomyces sp. NPDC002845]
MDIARYLATIDLLCARAFPSAHGRTDIGASGPGYFIAELETSHGLLTGDGSQREETARDFHAYREGLAQRLNDRWAEQPLWGQLTLRVRMGRGEKIPEPWATLSLRTDALHVWQVDGTGRWVAVGVADRDEADEIRLLAAVAETGPP